MPPETTLNADYVRHGWVFPLAAAVGAGTFFGIVKLIVWVVS